jgi:hypothetical protein
MTDKEFFKEGSRLVLNMCAAHKDPRVRALAASSDFLSEVFSEVQLAAGRAIDRTAAEATKIAKDVFKTLLK